MEGDIRKQRWSIKKILISNYSESEHFCTSCIYFRTQSTLVDWFYPLWNLKILFETVIANFVTQSNIHTEICFKKIVILPVNFKELLPNDLLWSSTFSIRYKKQQSRHIRYLIDNLIRYSLAISKIIWTDYVKGAAIWKNPSI